MSRIRRELAQVCQENLFTEKILLCPDYASGHSLLERYALDGGSWLNLRIATVDSLTREAAEPALIQKGLTMIPDGSGALILEGIFRNLHPDLEYFYVLGPRPGITAALYRVVRELRLCGIDQSALTVAPFAEPAKQRDLVKILTAYQDALQQHRYADPADIYRLANEAVSTKPATEIIFLVSADTTLLPYQKAFLEQLAGRNLQILSSRPVFKLRPPRCSWPQPDEIKEMPRHQIERLPWLYDRDAAPPVTADADDRSLELFAAYGEYNEAAEVLRRIRDGTLPLDQVAIGYTSYDYVWHFHGIAADLELPVTFAEGIPVLLTAPGKALKGFLRWIESGFQAATLCQELLAEGVLRLGEETPSSLRTADILRGAGVCWGRERYTPCLERYAQHWEGKAESARSDGSRSYRQKRADDSRRLIPPIERIMTLLPVPDQDDLVSLSALANGLADFTLEFTAVTGATDRVARQAAAEHFKSIAQSADLRLTLGEALERLHRELAGLRILAYGPEAGHLHIMPYRRLHWVGRSHTFVVGLDGGRFPGSATECPVLADAERAALSPALTLAADRPGDALYTLVRTLANLDGELTLSYSMYDTMASREAVPAAVLLQAYRLTHHPDADYSALRQALQPPVGFVHPGREVTPDEWWLAKLIANGAVHPQAVTDCFPWLNRGLTASAARKPDTLSAYDGKLTVSPERFDPRLNPDLILSPSQIELLATCPYRYFLRYALGIERPADRPLDPGTWLDAIEMGGLMHDIYRTYYQRLTATGPVTAQNQTMLMEVAEELVALKAVEVPPPSEVLFEREKRAMARSLELFLRSEDQWHRSQPMYFEVPFGLGDEAVTEAGIGLAKPISVDLGDGTSIRLRGRIDRLDKAVDGYLAMDYKTGSGKNYNEQNPFDRGRRVQHALYALAAEAILRVGPDPQAKVPVSGYYFPTEKGNAHWTPYDQTDRAPIRRVLQLLCDLLRTGCFVAAEDAKGCYKCDYAAACRGTDAVDLMKARMKAEGIPELDTLREVARID
ncbi:MAG: PD-(D/E)XK nuclease family protein [Eubacteriales bacterium]|nr:PD-(D/E)XK nuclease family protein [Eubacteriales bacterium]MDZ4044083.1 PD-(D/E)XK nuclease family protein [Eubacteriales bacterium]MDZ7610813.1 PD-(D/E)XK nuclease family protein [Eubacteriales bacterium]